MHKQFSRDFDLLLVEEKDWMLDYLLSGKGVVPYGKIRSYEDLDAVPE